jgi:hypothetical protein
MITRIQAPRPLNCSELAPALARLWVPTLDSGVCTHRFWWDRLHCACPVGFFRCDITASCPASTTGWETCGALVAGFFGAKSPCLAVTEDHCNSLVIV